MLHFGCQIAVVSPPVLFLSEVILSSPGDLPARKLNFWPTISLLLSARLPSFPAPRSFRVYTGIPSATCRANKFLLPVSRSGILRGFYWPQLDLESPPAGLLGLFSVYALKNFLDVNCSLIRQAFSSQRSSLGRAFHPLDITFSPRHLKAGHLRIFPPRLACSSGCP